MVAKRYWVIAPYDSTQAQIFEKAWDYDLKNGVIAVGWTELGDVSKMSESELKDKIKQVYGEKSFTLNFNSVWRFYHEISLEDVVIARQGTKKVVGVGTVIKTGFYNEQMGRDRVANLTDRPYPNFVGVSWEKKEIEFDRIVFSFQTIYEISEEKYRQLIEEKPPPPEEEKYEFRLERDLQEFIVSNFDRVFRGELKLYRNPDGSIGQYYPTDIGEIDILAEETETNSYVVIELKIGRGSDNVVGQILRYMGWVKENLCREGQDVKGLIICKDEDPQLTYALKAVPNVGVKFYKVNFQLSSEVAS